MVSLVIAARVGFNLQLGKQLHYNMDAFDCSIPTIDGEEVLATEDLVAYVPGVLIGGSGTTMCITDDGPENCPQGYLVVLDVRSGTPKLSKGKIVGEPKEFPFHPHGISYSPKSNRLYVINHGGISSIGSRVEVFSVKQSGLALEFIWIMAVGSGHVFPNGAINSVTEGATENDIYVTRWLSFPVPNKGVKHPESLKERFGVMVNFLADLLAVYGNTGVYRCVFDVDSKSTISCKYVSYGFVHANGITTNPERTKLYVNDPTPRKTYVFNMLEDGELVEDKVIILPHLIDNIHYEDGELWYATIPKVHEYLQREHAPVSGTFLVCDPEGNDCKDILTFNGSLLSGSSGCAKVSNGQKTWLACGSPYGRGVQMCIAK